MEEKINTETEEEAKFKKAADYITKNVEEKINEVHTVLDNVPLWMAIAILDILKGRFEYDLSRGLKK